MSVAVEPQRTEPQQATQPQAPAKLAEPVLGVTTFDRVFATLLTCILIFGLVTAAFGAIWLSNQKWYVPMPPAQLEVVEFIEDVEGGGAEDGELGSSLYAPGPESADVTLAVDIQDTVMADTPPIDQTMKDVLNALSSVVSDPEQLAMAADVGMPSTLPGGNPKGTGTKRNLGKGPGDGGGVKRNERWEISFESGQTEQEYARQLDYFKIEVGAIMDGKIHYVTQLASPRPTIRVAPGGSDDKRLYFSWRTGGRRQIDLNLLNKAGVAASGNAIVLQFYPTETEQYLARMERDYLEKAKATKDLRIVRKTKFLVVRDKGGKPYDFEITKQEYFGQPSS
jgi:hypothetical protein